MDKGPRIEATQVEEFVSKAHSDLSAIERLLDQSPALVNASWDWGGGDWESGLGAAAHMGRRDIALLLLDRGARLDLFAAAMLGQLAVVRAALEAFPAALTTPGAHGIPLIHHARVGGPEAEPVLRYLETLDAG